MNKSLLSRLLQRGDRVGIQCGRLHIYPSSLRPVPKEWFEENAQAIVCEILKLLDEEAYQYEGYSTGSYGNVKAGGVTLQFIGVRRGEERYSIFNADLTRARSTKHGKLGAPLPKGHFRVGKRSNFVKFWREAELPMPKLSSFHDYLGNLDTLYFDVEDESQKRIQNTEIHPLSLSAEEIFLAHKSQFKPDKPQTRAIQSTDNSPPSLPDKLSLIAQTGRAFEPDSSTRETNCGLSYQGGAGVRTDILDPRDQSVEEWLEDYKNEEREMNAAKRQ